MQWIITVKITQKDSPTIYPFSETTLRKYVENFFKARSEDKIEIEEIQEEKEEPEKIEEITHQQKFNEMENLIYQMYENKFNCKSDCSNFWNKS